MDRIFVKDSVELQEPWTFVPVAENQLDGTDLLAHRMVTAWRPTEVTAKDSTTVADESGLDGPELLAHRMANAWKRSAE